MNEPQTEVANTVPEFEDWDGFFFDTQFFEAHGSDEMYDEQNIAIFKMVRGDEVKYLHLFNIHNGYYAHGFDFKKDDETIRKGCL